MSRRRRSIFGGYWMFGGGVHRTETCVRRIISIPGSECIPLLDIRVVERLERIHRSNLINAGL